MLPGHRYQLKVSTITRQHVAQALRHLRITRGLTQKQVAERGASLQGSAFGFGRLLESQISDFECGRTLPSFGSLLTFLAACSESGDTVTFAAFDDALAEMSGIETSSIESAPAASRARSPGPSAHRSVQLDWKASLPSSAAAWSRQLPD